MRSVSGGRHAAVGALGSELLVFLAITTQYAMASHWPGINNFLRSLPGAAMGCRTPSGSSDPMATSPAPGPHLRLLAQMYKMRLGYLSDSCNAAIATTVAAAVPASR